LKDYVLREGWIVQPEHVRESAVLKLKAEVKKEKPPGPKTRQLERHLARTYRILLSRAIRGVYVWFEDQETREYVESKLRRAQP